MKTTVMASAALLVASALPAQVLDLRELNTEQIRRLDRAKTAVLACEDGWPGYFGAPARAKKWTAR